MLINASQSLLLLIDLQERLAPAIAEIDQVLEHNLWLCKVADKLSVPTLVTEQYPQGLGPTVSAIAAGIPPSRIVQKIHFSAVADGCLGGLPDFSRSQIVLTGTEAHVCVLQTAIDLLALGKSVFVVAEAVGSRCPRDKTLALERMQQLGCQIVSREMVAFEWLHKAGTDTFRSISRDFLR